MTDLPETDGDDSTPQPEPPGGWPEEPPPPPYVDEPPGSTPGTSGPDQD